MKKWVLVRGETSLHYIFWEINREHKKDEDKYDTMLWHGSDWLDNTDIAPAQFPGLSVGEMEKNSVALRKLSLDLQWINQEKHFLLSTYI